MPAVRIPLKIIMKMKTMYKMTKVMEISDRMKPHLPNVLEKSLSPSFHDFHPVKRAIIGK